MGANKKTGFTLIELSIAIFLLTMGVLAVLTIFPMGSKVEKSTQVLAVAIQLEQGKMEEVLSQSYGAILVGSTTEDYGTISGFTPYKRVTEIGYYDPVNATITDSDSGIKMIEVTVFWESSLGAPEQNTKIISLTTKR